ALAGVFVLFQAAVKALVHFDLARQLRAISAFIERRADLFEHAPCSFVGNAKLPLQLLGADTATRRGHQVHRVKPEFQRRCRILKDSPAHWMFVASAELTAIRWASFGAMMLGTLLAFGQ